MGAFFQEMLRVGIYKRSQGRITRQITFAGLAVVIALGLMRLSTILHGADPVVSASPAKVTCTAKDGRVEADATLKLSGGPGKAATIPLKSGEDFAKVVEAVNAESSTTGVNATTHDDKSGDALLILSSSVVGADGFLQVEGLKDAMQAAGLNDDGIARGRDALNLGLRFLIPGVLLMIFLWMAYRVVNVPSFADFLIAVEAEMNKVSWPTRPELFRASTVVLIVIFFMAALLAVYDVFWKVLLSWVLHIFQ